MIVDSSALIAIIGREPERDAFERLLAAAARPRLSAVGFVETCMVVEGRLGLTTTIVDDVIRSAGIEVVPVTVDQARLARDAFRRFGKGRHRARLNLGDCFAYALARSEGAALLFKGGDFARTDVKVAA